MKELISQTQINRKNNALIYINKILIYLKKIIEKLDMRIEIFLSIISYAQAGNREIISDS